MEGFYSSHTTREAASAAVVTRPVRLGLATVNGIWPFATHWAVQVEDTWFEVAGASKEENSTEMNVAVSNGEKSQVGADVGRFGHVGTTTKRNDEIEGFIQKWKDDNPKYSFGRENCQKFAREFIGWLTDESFEAAVRLDDPTPSVAFHFGCCRRMVVKGRPKTLKEGGGLLRPDGTDVARGSALEVLDEGWCCSRTHKPLPMMDAGVGAGRKHGPHFWHGAEAFEGNTQVYAGATVANLQGHNVLWNGELKGPTASVNANVGTQGIGAFSEAELGRTEGGIGPLRVALHCNLNTGVGVRNQGVEISALGVGATVGANGFSTSLPCLTCGLGQR